MKQNERFGGRYGGYDIGDDACDIGYEYEGFDGGYGGYGWIWWWRTWKMFWRICW